MGHDCGQGWALPPLAGIEVKPDLEGEPRSVERGEHGPKAHFLREDQSPLLLVVTQPLN
jgi:hypothetical protein